MCVNGNNKFYAVADVLFCTLKTTCPEQMLCYTSITTSEVCTITILALLMFLNREVPSVGNWWCDVTDMSNVKSFSEA
jgi:hypothetical protein